MIRLLPCVLVAGILLTGCHASGEHAAGEHAASGRTRIEVSVSRCGVGWTDAKAGAQHFDLVNQDTRAGEVQLTDVATGAVYADVEPLGPGTRKSLDVDLGSGGYAFRCAMEDEAATVGPTVRIPGDAKGTTPGVLPVSQTDLLAPTQAYETYVRQGIPTLSSLTRRMSDAIKRGDLAAARRAWLPAHLEYERFGAAYDAFGDLDGQINGLPTGLSGGVHDTRWAGFHRVEYGLWHGETALSLRRPAEKLVAAIGKLQKTFVTAQIAPLDVSIRAHEITENALQFELTGETDFGSHSNLATVSANLEGTRTVLDLLRPLLVDRFGQLLDLGTQLDRAQADVDALKGGGVWPPLTSLTSAQRERIDSDVSELCELLAPVASILEPRRTS